MIFSLLKRNSGFQKGFSLHELIVVIAISGIIAAITLVSFNTVRQSKSLDAEVLSVLSLLEKARADTLGSKSSSQYGVHLETTKAVLFTGTSYSSSSASNVTAVLSPSMQISSISLTGGGSNVVFDGLTGSTAQSGTVTLSSVSASSSKTISIGATGISQVQ